MKVKDLLKLGIKQSEIAERCKVSPALVTRWKKIGIPAKHEEKLQKMKYFQKAKLSKLVDCE
jgi:transcriptional regulator with XRE-family HTH domain